MIKSGFRNPALVLMTALMSISTALSYSFADESMELVATIVVERDSTYMTSLTPIGDFNADGYPDIAIGVRQDLPDLYEALYLYFGGPDFDSSPDLVIPGEPQNTNSACFFDMDLMTYFGTVVRGLSDHNGDGYDDIAVAAPQFCPDYYREGRIYVYLGSSQPDTVVDLIISGHTYWGNLGEYMNSGDYNGDDFGDLLATENIAVELDARAYIYTGSRSPDDRNDWQYNTQPYQESIITDWSKSGFDLNNDGFDDFDLRIFDPDSSIDAVFLGGDPLEDEPTFSVYNRRVAFTDDISGDGIDDVLIRQDFLSYLCLGGNPLDLEPDYYIGDRGFSPFTYTLVGDGIKLMLDDPYEHEFIMYNTGVPFDTIPRAIFGYDHLRQSDKPNIGDINADGVEDLAFLVNDDTLITYARIYSIIRTDISDDPDAGLPVDRSILSCYPNPFNSSVTIAYQSPSKSADNITIEVYNVLGKRVRSFREKGCNAGSVQVVWDATDESGQEASSGIYFARARGAGYDKTIKLIYLR